MTATRGMMFFGIIEKHQYNSPSPPLTWYVVPAQNCFISPLQPATTAEVITVKGTK